MTQGDKDLIPTTETRSSTELGRVASRERAVSRIFAGGIMMGAGTIGLVAVELAGALLGLSQSAQQVASIGGRSLMWLGFFIAATATPHLVRFGGRRGALALASLAGMGAGGLLAVAEQFETWFLDSQVLRGWDVWGLGGVVFFGMMCGMLMALELRLGRGDPEEPSEA